MGNVPLQSEDIFAEFAKKPVGGTPAQRNNNPGNLRMDNGDWQTFNSVQDGFDALMRDIDAKKAGKSRYKISGDSSLEDFFGLYAPKEENNTKQYIATVAKRLGITKDTKIKNINTLDLAEQISRFEDNDLYKNSVKSIIDSLRTPSDIFSEFKKIGDTSSSSNIQQAGSLTTPEIPDFTAIQSDRKGALSGAFDAIGNFAEGAKDLFTHPETIIPALKSGSISAARGLGALVQHPIDGIKAILVDGIFNPLIRYPIELTIDKNLANFNELSDTDRYERGKEVTANYAGLLVGAAIGKAIGATTAAGKLLRVAKPSNIEELKDLVFAMPTADQLELAGLSAKVTSKQAISATLLKGTSEGIAGGITTGFMQGDTPEERFQNAVNYGFAGALIGNFFELKGAKATAKRLNTVKAVVHEMSVKNNTKVLFDALEPIDKARFAEDLLKGVPVENAFLDWNVPRNTVVLDNLTSVSDRVRNSPNAAVAENPNGTFRVMIDGRLSNIAKLRDSKITTDISLRNPDASYEKLNTLNRRIDNLYKKLEALNEDPNSDLDEVHNLNRKIDDLEKQAYELDQLKEQGKLTSEAKPLEFYHGTGRAFPEFDPSKSARGLYTPEGEGIYATEATDVSSGKQGYAINRALNRNDIIKDNNYHSVINNLENVVLERLKADNASTETVKAITTEIDFLRENPPGPNGPPITVGDLYDIVATQLGLEGYTRNDLYDLVGRATSDVTNIAPNTRRFYIDARNPLDLDKKLSQAEYQLFEDKYVTDYYNSLDPTQKSLWNGKATERLANTQFRDEAIRHGVKENDGISYLKLRMRKNLGMSQEFRTDDLNMAAIIETANVYELDFQSSSNPLLTSKRILDTNRALGYDAYIHEGGRNTGTNPHRVVIAFDPKQIIYTSDFAGFNKNMLAAFRKDKFLPNQEVLIKGKPYMYIDNPDGKQIKARVMNLQTGKVTLRDFNKLAYSDEFRIVENPTYNADAKKIEYELKQSQPYLIVPNPKAQYNELLAKLEPGDRLIYEKNLAEFEAHEESRAITIAEDAASKGYFLRRTEGGKVEVLNPATNETVGVFRNNALAQEFIDKAPIVGDVYKLDAGGNGPNLPIPPSIPGESFEPSPLGDAKRWGANWLNNVKLGYLNKLINRRELFLAIEHRWKNSRFYNDIFQPMQLATQKLFALRVPAINEISAIVKMYPEIQKSSELRGQVLDLISRRSEADFRDIGYYAGRKMTPDELGLGEQLASELGKNPASLERILKYRTAVDEINATSIKDKDAKIADYINAEFNGNGLTSEELAGLKTLQQAIAKKTDLSVPAIIDYASSIINEVKNEADYIRENKISPNVVNAANNLRKFFSKYSEKYGKPPEQLFRYIQHVKNFSDGLVEKSFVRSELTELEKNVFKAIKNYQMAAYTIDPFDLAVKYVDTALNMEHVAPIQKKAYEALNSAVKDIATESPIAARKIKDIGEQYLYEISGGPNSFDGLVNAAFYDASSKLAPRVAERTRTSFVNTWMRIVEFAAQGFKPLAGVRDVASGLAMIHMRYGEDGLARVMRTFEDAYNNREFFKQAGIIPGLAPNRFETALDVAARESLSGVRGTVSKAEQFIKKIEEQGFRFSGQPTAYEFMHAAVYLERLKTGTKAIADFVNKKISREKFDDILDLNTYDPVIIKEFDRLLATDTDKALKYLARVSGEELVGYYGMANHPMFMSSKYGKVLGQFGQWPIWFLNTSSRMLASAPLKKKATIAARMSAVSAAYALGGSSLGFNLNNWRTDPIANVYTFSPAADIMWWLLKSTSNYGPTREFAQDQLLNYVDFSNPRKIYLPVPFQVYDLIEAGQRILQGDPAHIVTWKLVGGSVDVTQYPRP